MKKKMLAVFIVLLMAVMLVPTAAFAAPITGGVDLSAATADASGDGWSWKQSTKTLTLNGVDLTEGYSNGNGFNLPDGASVVINGRNKITADGYGILCPLGSISISGTGTLEINANFGIYVDSVTIYSGTLTFNCDYDGIYAETTVTISGGTLTFECNDYGIEVDEDGSVAISGGKLNFNCGDHGIDVDEDGELVISGGTINIIAECHGIYVDDGEAIFIGGYTSIATTDGDRDAIYAEDGIVFGFGMVVINGVVDDDGNDIDMAGNEPVIIKSILSESIPVGGDTRYMPFADVQPGTWYYEDVYYCYDNGIMNGVETYRFGPEEPITRGMIVAILWRNEGSPYASGKSFKDVAEGMYYSEAVKWAISKGIITGYGDGTFRPDEEVSLEELGAIMFRYAAHKNLDTTARGGLSVYADSDEIGQWAKSAMSWAEAYGMIDGIVGGRLKPAGAATRAQAAAMLARLPKAEEPNGIIMAQFTGGYDGGMTEPPYDVPLG